MGSPTVCVLMLVLVSSTPHYLHSLALDENTRDTYQHSGLTWLDMLNKPTINVNISLSWGKRRIYSKMFSLSRQQYSDFASHNRNSVIMSAFHLRPTSDLDETTNNMSQSPQPLRVLSEKPTDRRGFVMSNFSISSFLSLLTSCLFAPTIDMTPVVPTIRYRLHRTRKKRSASPEVKDKKPDSPTKVYNGDLRSTYDVDVANSTSSSITDSVLLESKTPDDVFGSFHETFLPYTNYPEAQRRTLRIGGLFELSGKYGGNGYSELDAANLAVTHINEQNIIPGYTLELLYNDSKCDPGVGTDAFFDFIYRKSNESSLVMVMGSACTEVTKTIAEIVPYWNLILISYAAKSPALSEREKYRTFFRLALGDSALNPARRMLIQHFGWDKVAALYEDLESLSLNFNEINEDFTSHDIVIKSSSSFKDAAVEVPGKLRELRDLDVRIIIAGFTESAARQVFCEAYKQDMYGERYVWILVGGFKHQWWNEAEDTPCSQSQLAAAVEGVFSVFSPNGLLDGGKSVANLTSSEFLSAYFNANGSRPLSMFAASTYDTVWTIALTVRQAIDKWAKNGTAPVLDQLTYDTMENVKETFISTMENLEFPGVSGPVSFKGSDREGIAVIYQVQGGNFTQVAVHQPTSVSLNFDCKVCHSIIWQGGHVPKDEQIVVPRLKMIELSVFYCSTGLCVGGIILAVVFLTYNLYHRRLKFIKLSSPKLNNVAVIGCILVYTAVIMLGVDDRLLTQDSFPIVCSARAFLLAAGFSLAFGAMFAKTFRVHQIFTRAHHGLVKSKLIQDTHLLVIIGVLLAVDSALVFVWVFVDPMRRHVTNTTREVSAQDEDLIFQEQLASCHSDHLQKWLGAFYAYKGLLLIFGVYMAWETRHVKIPALNDSQYIGLNVYNVVIMSVSVVVISNILSSQPTLAYAMEAAFMFLSTTVTLCLLFVPKIYAIVTSGGNPVIASMGIVVDNSNTRRFVFDDRKEIYYRAEVQNRVYKRELVELEQQIVRLERLLEIPLQPYPRLTEELLYLLPESKVDGTPRCHRRYKRELERCNSISDGGEGVTYGLSEHDDILMELAFGSSLSPKTSINKRHSSVETSKSGTSAIQKLTRSFSIGGSSSRSSSRGHSRKKGHATPVAKTSLPVSSSESSFMNSLSNVDNYGICRLNVHSGKPNRYSDDLTYLKKDKLCMSHYNFKKNSSVPMLDKITQTSCDSSSKGAPGGDAAERRHSHRLASETADIELGHIHSDSSYEGDDDEENAFARYSRNTYHWQLLNNPVPGRLFAVRQLQIESVDDSSNSTNTCDDTESVCDLTTASLCKNGDVIFSLSPDEPETGGQLKERVIAPSMGYQTDHEQRAKITQTNHARSRSSIFPKPAGSTPAPDSLWSSGSDSTASQVLLPHPPPPPPPSSTTTTKSPDIQLHRPVPTTPSCLVPSDTNLNDSTDSVFYSLPILSREDYATPTFSQNPPSSWGFSATASKRSKSPDRSQYIPLTCVTQTPSHLCPSAGENMPVSSSNAPVLSNHMPSELSPTPAIPTCIACGVLAIKNSDSKLLDTTHSPLEVKVAHSSPYRKSLQETRLQNQEELLFLENSGKSSAQLKNTKGIIEVERRKRIQKLQDDLIRIQKELQDLNDLEYDVSEV